MKGRKLGRNFIKEENELTEEEQRLSKKRERREKKGIKKWKKIWNDIHVIKKRNRKKRSF